MAAHAAKLYHMLSVWSESLILVQKKQPYLSSMCSTLGLPFNVILKAAG